MAWSSHDEKLGMPYPPGGAGGSGAAVAMLAFTRETPHMPCEAASIWVSHGSMPLGLEVLTMYAAALRVHVEVGRADSQGGRWNTAP